MEGDEKTGAKVVLKALEAPLFHISANAGLEGAVIINKVRESEVGTGAVCKNGAGVAFSEEEAAKILNKDEIYIHVHLNQGEASAKAWGCDLTYDYVKINGDYRS